MKIKTRLLLAFILSLICSVSHAEGWNPNGWNPQGLSTTDSPTFADLTLTGQLFLSSGSSSAPSIQFNTNATGIWIDTGGEIVFRANSTNGFEVTNLYMGSGNSARAAIFNETPTATNPNILPMRANTGYGLGGDPSASPPYISLITNDTEAVRLGTETVMFWATTFGTNADQTVSVGNAVGTPTTSIANGIQWWAEDVGGSSEFRVRDEAGNVTTLSPHNFSKFSPDIAEPLPFSYYSENNVLGKSMNVDMIGMIREVEALSGKQFVYVSDIPKLVNWSDIQEGIRLRREQEIQEAQDRTTSLDAQIAVETKPEEIAKLQEQKLQVKVPDSYTKKQPPQWMKDRGISLQ